MPVSNAVHTIDLNQCKKGDNGGLVANITITTCHAVIISPSFGCPGVFEPDKPITLYVLADQEFKDQYDCDLNYLKKNVINYHLKISKWNDLVCRDEMIYAPGDAPGKIDCTFLYDLHAQEVQTPGPRGTTSTRTIPAEVRICTDKDKKIPVALLRESTRDYYQEGDGKDRPAMPYLFKIELKPGMATPLDPNVLYDCAWFVVLKDKNAHKFGETQDVACRQVALDSSPELKPEYLFKVTDGKVNFAEQDKSSPIQSYHPFIVSKKDKLNFGHLSDVHISARQVAFRESKACVFEGGVLTDTSCVSGEPIGKLFNSSLESFGDMLKTMMSDSEIDAIVITGDLVDHAYNFNPTVKYSKPGELWTYMDRKNPDNQKHYQPYIDNLAVLSLFKHCYDTYEKPIFLITGNHDNYKDIFAISPRVGSEKGIVRGNSGLPADHNLTIYEACLMYGPKYHEYFKGNFQAPYADWFYHLFTPLTDYRFTFKQQSVVGLGWGDSEEILNTGIFSLDMTLYRAAESVSDKQLELINAASKEGSQRLICSHFPFVSYDVGIGITTQGSVNCNDLLKTVDLYSQGTFKQNRAEVYQLLHDKKFHCTLSGHSHRSGVYAGSMHTSYGRKNFIVNGKEIPHDTTAPLSTSQCNMIVSGCSGPVGVQNNYDSTSVGLGSFGLDYPSGNNVNLASNTIKRIIPNPANVATAKPRFAVALDYMDIMGRESNLGPLGKAVGSQNSDDRDGKAGVFTSIVSDAAGSTFTFTLNKALPEEQFIKGISIVAYVDGGFKEFKMGSVKENKVGAVQKERGSVLEVSLEGAHKKVVSDKLTVSAINKFAPPTFLSITFNHALSGTTGYTQYNFDSPWIYAIEILNRKDELKKELERRDDMDSYQIQQEVALVNGYVVRRHEKHGELPNFGWYNKTFGYDYQGKLPLE